MDNSDTELSRLLWDEYPHVKRCVKRTLEFNVVRRELPYGAAVQQALDMYKTDRLLRAATGDALAHTLDALGRGLGNKNDTLSPHRAHGGAATFPCPISATLFTANYDIQSLLVSQDPLVKQAEDFLRATIERLAAHGRARCTFDAVTEQYLEFAARHRDRLVASVVASGVGTVPSPKVQHSLQPHTAHLAGRSVLFPTAAAWAAFVANRTLWQRLPGAPTPVALEDPTKPQPRVREHAPVLPVHLPLSHSHQHPSSVPAATTVTAAAAATTATAHPPLSSLFYQPPPRRPIVSHPSPPRVSRAVSPVQRVLRTPSPADEPNAAAADGDGGGSGEGGDDDDLTVAVRVAGVAFVEPVQRVVGIPVTALDDDTAETAAAETAVGTAATTTTAAGAGTTTTRSRRWMQGPFEHRKWPRGTWRDAPPHVPASAHVQGRAVFVLAPDLEEWEQAHEDA